MNSDLDQPLLEPEDENHLDPSLDDFFGFLPCTPSFKHDQISQKQHPTGRTISEDLGSGHSRARDGDLKLLARKETNLATGRSVGEPSGQSKYPSSYEKSFLQYLPPSSTSYLSYGSPPFDIAVDCPIDDCPMIMGLLQPQKRRASTDLEKKDTASDEVNQDESMLHIDEAEPASADALRSAKRLKEVHKPQGQIKETSFEVACQDNGGQSPVITKPNGTSQNSTAHFMLLYRIVCPSRANHHPMTIFRGLPSVEEMPARTKSWELRPHLVGEDPVFDLDDLLEDDTNDSAFIIVRTVTCSVASTFKISTGEMPKYIETLHTKSSLAQSIIRSTTTCYFQKTTQDPEADGRHRIDQRSILTPLQRREIYPADRFIYHHRQILKEYAAEHSSHAAIVESLLQYMEGLHGTQFFEADSLFEAGTTDSTHILKLFKPNELVVSKHNDQCSAYVLQEWPTVDRNGYTMLACWSFETDGTKFTRKRKVLKIPPVDGTVPITELEAYPIRFCPADLKKAIYWRGKLHWSLRKPTHVTYRGWSVDRVEYYPDARFMIDHATYRVMHPESDLFKFERAPLPHAHDPLPEYLDTEKEPEDSAFYLLPYDVRGFYLNEKKWIRVLVDRIHPVQWKKEAFQRLVLPTQTKDLIQALVTVRASQSGVKQGIGLAGKRIDITPGKGNGLIMLLHGGPGTGKTLTAESVAEIAEKPLYRVTCGDIGTNPEAAEMYLNSVLHLSNVWGCVLLLDEADIFLEERSMSDLKRNSLVSVFLRILEYYDGILILTSNRIGIFDEAFKSRIQVALHYENLNRAARKKIWQNFLDMLEEDEEDANFDELKLHLEELAGKDLNGRQIRNALTTARQLATYRKERLDWGHLEQALMVASNFSEYLKRIYGHSDEQRARDSQLR